MTTAALAAGLVAVAAVTFAPENAGANGYEQGLQGGPSAGLSGAVTGRPNVPEAGHYNPAGWVLQERWGASVGGSGLFPLVEYQGAAGERTRAEVDGAFPPYFHAFGRYGDFGAGISLGVPYGSSLQWPEDWPGRFEATSIRFRTVEAAPSVAWRMTDRFALGAGPRLIWADLGLERFREETEENEERFIGVDATAPAVGAQAAIWGDIGERWDIGASWRSGTELAFEGTAQFGEAGDEPTARETTAETERVLPHRFALGIAYEVAAQGTISLDIDYNLWSAVDSFEVRFDSDELDDISEDRDWNNTIGMSAGAEYAAPVDGLAVRTGLAYEPSPAPEGTVTAVEPDTDRTITSLGLGYEPFERLEIDLAYNFILLSRTTSAEEGPSGVYDGFVHAFTLGLRTRPYE